MDVADLASTARQLHPVIANIHEVAYFADEPTEALMAFGLPRPQIDAVVDGMRARGLVDESGRISELGRQTKEQVESTTDRLATVAYADLEPGDLDQFIADLEPIGAALNPKSR